MSNFAVALVISQVVPVASGALPQSTGHANFGTNGPIWVLVDGRPRRRRGTLHASNGAMAALPFRIVSFGTLEKLRVAALRDARRCPTHQRALHATLVSSALVLAGCGARTELDTTSPVDGGANLDSPSGDGDVADASGPKYGGVIGMSNFGASNSYGAFYWAFAEFYTPYHQNLCKHSTSGSCDVNECTDFAGVGATSAGAGTITLTGGADQLQFVPPYGARPSGHKQLWSGGEVMHAVAPGDMVPGFDLKLIAPGQVTLTSPLAPPTPIAKLVLDRTRNLVVSWVGETSGDVVVWLGGGARVTGEKSHYIQCKFPASAGTGTVPAAAIASIPWASVGKHFSVYSESSVYQEKSGLGLTFQAQFMGKFANGAWASVEPDIP